MSFLKKKSYPKAVVSGGAITTGYSGNTGYTGAIGYTGYSGSYTTTSTTPEPNTYPESSAAAAGFAAGIKHALNAIMGACKNNPEKAKLYEDLMSAAVKVVLAPEASDELSRRALFIHGNSWAVVMDVGETTPEEITLSGVNFYLTDLVSEECPMAVYRSR